MPFAQDKERPIWGQSDIVMPFAVIVPQSRADPSTMALLTKTYAALLGRGVESCRCASLSSGLGPVYYATRYDELCNLLAELSVHRGLQQRQRTYKEPCVRLVSSWSLKRRRRYRRGLLAECILHFMNTLQSWPSEEQMLNHRCAGLPRLCIPHRTI